MYLVAAAAKRRSFAWTRELDALQLFLQFPYVDRGLPGLGAWLLRHEAIAHFLTWSTPVAEAVLPLLLVLPTPRRFEGALRAIVLPPLLSLQLGIQLVIGCGVLPLLNTAVLLAFVPAAAWEPARGEEGEAGRRGAALGGAGRGGAGRGGAGRGEAAIDQAALLEPSPLLDPEAAEHERAGSDALLPSPPPPPPPPPPWWRWQQRWQARLQLLRRVAAAAWSLGALWLMLAN